MSGDPGQGLRQRSRSHRVQPTLDLALRRYICGGPVPARSTGILSALLGIALSEVEGHPSTLLAGVVPAAVEWESRCEEDAQVNGKC